MEQRKFKDVPASVLTQKLRDVFQENKELFQELVIRGWDIDLLLPTIGWRGTFGYSPSQLADHAGFRVQRPISPSVAEGLVENRPGLHERFR